MFQSLTTGGKVAGGVSGKGSKGAARAVVFGQFQGEGLDEGTKKAAKEIGVLEVLTDLAGRSESTGEAGVVTEQAIGGKDGGKGAVGRVVLVGMGKKAGFEVCAVRGAAAAVGRKLAALKVTSAVIALDGAIQSAKGGASAVEKSGHNFGEALGLLAWVCDDFKGSGTTAAKRVALHVTALNKAFQDGMESGMAYAEAANLTRTLSQTPPNIATPEWMAEQAKKAGKKYGFSVSVIEGDALKREKMIGHIAVGSASENKPCIIRLEYTPKGGAKKSGKKDADKPVVLVGKTVTYDTGGLSLKINNGMVGMKRDKDGGCAVLGAMCAIAGVVKPSKRVVAYLAAAENSISDEAYRPDDILRYRNNVTVEVTNTDAEGRLVLADALILACEKDDPAYIVDLATLTGGVVVALGSTYCGMFCENDRLRGKIEAAADASGERVWRLPMHQEYRDMMKSPVADILNSNPNRKAHPIQGAAFLSYFVEEKVPWCHLDIAGVHVAEKNAGMFVDGPTGWGVRLLANLLAKE